MRRLARLPVIRRYAQVLDEAEHQWQKDVIWASIGLSAGLSALVIYSAVKLIGMAL
jgi:hypothetical protein